MLVKSANTQGNEAMPRPLAERVAALETNQKHHATRADIEKLASTLTWRIIIAMGVMTGIFAYFVQNLI